MNRTAVRADTVTARRIGIGGGNEYPPFRLSCRIIPTDQSFRTYHEQFTDDSPRSGSSPARYGASFAPAAARFRLSKVFSRLLWRDFGVQKCFCAFFGVFSVFKSAFVAFLARFWLSKILSWLVSACFYALGAFPRLARHDFGVREHSRCLPGAVSAFGSVPTACPARSRRWRTRFSRLTSSCGR